MNLSMDQPTVDGLVERGQGGAAKLVDSFVYLNTAITPIDEKSRTLVGLGEQKKLLARGGIPVLVQGPSDALAVDRLSRLTRCRMGRVSPLPAPDYRLSRATC